MSDIKNTYGTSLIAHYSLEETSGTRYDSHGSYNLTDNNTVTYDTGKQGNAATFNDANSEMLTVANTIFQLGTGDYSVSLWVRPHDTSGLKGILCWFDQSPSRGWTIVQNGADLLVYHQGIDGVSIPSFFSANTWVHIVVTYDATNDDLYVYKNAGTPSTNLNIGYSSTASAYLAVGNYGDGLSYYFDGDIDEISIWGGRILNSTEISDIYNSGSGIPYDAGGASGPATLKTRDTVAVASTKTIDTTAIASVKTVDTIA